MNQLEIWHESRIIELQISNPAQAEAAHGSASRARKAYGYIYTVTMSGTEPEAQLLRQIEMAMFPGGAATDSERNDVEIVFNAKKYLCTLVTNDGDSIRQKGGILGNREKLRTLGITVMTDEEAVGVVRALIRQRDENEREYSRVTGRQLPPWVGTD